MSEIVKVVRKVGELTLTFFLKDNIKHGYMTVHNKGVKELECLYKDGLLAGDFINYYTSGNIMSSFYYNDGKKNGAFSIWYESGVRQMVGYYQNDKYHGIVTTYDEFGDVIKIEQYESGKLHGKVVSYYPVNVSASTQTRQVMEIAFYDNGLLHGNKTSFMPSGKLMSIIPYNHGRPLRYGYR